MPPEGIALTAAVHAGSPCRLARSRLWLCFAVLGFSWSEWFLESSHGFLEEAVAFLGNIRKW